jgi:hypothetical protein
MGPRASYPTPLLNINVEEPRVTIIVDKWKVIFLLDSEAHFFVLPFSPGPWSNDKFIIRGLSGQPLECYFTCPPVCSWGYLHFCHSFLIVPETPVPLLGWDLLSQLKAQILLPTGDYLCCPPSSGTNRSHSVDWWNDCRVSQNGPPDSNKTQRSLTVSTSKTVSLKPEGWWGLLLIINSLIK